jgi:hypothetical protein
MSTKKKPEEKTTAPEKTEATQAAAAEEKVEEVKETATTEAAAEETAKEEAATETADESAAAESGENAPAEESADVVKSGFYKVKVDKFSGSYKDAVFDDNGICSRISVDTLLALKSQYPGAKITPLDKAE